MGHGRSGVVVLLMPARRFIANRFALGYQIPPGLVLLGGPLVDAGYTVKLIYNDLYAWPGSRARGIGINQAFAP